jgi:hypothetical protein
MRSTVEPDTVAVCAEPYAHDVLGTYRLVADTDEMQRTPDSADEPAIAEVNSIRLRMPASVDRVGN